MALMIVRAQMFARVLFICVCIDFCTSTYDDVCVFADVCTGTDHLCMYTHLHKY
jgi:hypothetical protein